MGEKHLIKLSQIPRESVRKSRSNLNKYWTNYQKGRKGDIFSGITRKIDTGLLALFVPLRSNSSKCSARNRMPCRRS